MAEEVGTVKITGILKVFGKYLVLRNWKGRAHA